MYEIFQKLCEERGITPYRFCKDTGINSSTISTWKNKGSECSPKTAKAVCDYFGITMDYLMNGRTNKNKEVANTDLVAKDESERRLLMLCRKAGNVSSEEKKAIINNFEATIDMYLKAKGIKKE